MKLSRTAMLVTVASLAFAGAAAPTLAQMQMREQAVTVGGSPMYPSKNIIQNAVNSKDHTTLVAAVKAAGLVGTLQGPGPFTVFAPTNAAFAKLPPGTVDSLLKPEMKAKLAGVLTYHVVPGRLSAKDLMDAARKSGGTAEFKTVEGETILVETRGNTLVIVPAALLTNDPRAFELWLIPSGETRPRSLGLIQPGQPIRLDIPSDLAGHITPDATLAVSLEPPGGSPTGLPTGPVIAAGKLTNL